MPLLSRRAIVAAVLALPALAPDQALAAVRYPLKERPARMRPLGVWGMADRTPTAEVGEAAVVSLLFRPAIDVDTPVMRWWVPRWMPVGTTQARACVPTNISNATVLEPMIAGAIVPIGLDVPVPVPPRPNNVGKGEQRSDRTKERQTGPRKRLYRAFVEVGDPASCRKAGFSFNITVLDDYPP